MQVTLSVFDTLSPLLKFSRTYVVETASTTAEVAFATGHTTISTLNSAKKLLKEDAPQCYDPPGKSDFVKVGLVFKLSALNP